MKYMLIWSFGVKDFKVSTPFSDDFSNSCYRVNHLRDPISKMWNLTRLIWNYKPEDPKSRNGFNFGKSLVWDKHFFSMYFWKRKLDKKGSCAQLVPSKFQGLINRVDSHILVSPWKSGSCLKSLNFLPFFARGTSCTIWYFWPL